MSHMTMKPPIHAQHGQVVPHLPAVIQVQDTSQQSHVVPAHHVVLQQQAMVPPQPQLQQQAPPQPQRPQRMGRDEQIQDFR